MDVEFVYWMMGGLYLLSVILYIGWEVVDSIHRRLTPLASDLDQTLENLLIIESDFSSKKGPIRPTFAPQEIRRLLQIVKAHNRSKDRQLWTAFQPVLHTAEKIEPEEVAEVIQRLEKVLGCRDPEVLKVIDSALNRDLDIGSIREALAKAFDAATYDGLDFVKRPVATSTPSGGVTVKY